MSEPLAERERQRPKSDPAASSCRPAEELRLPLGDPDEELVRRVARGDAAAVEALVARKLPRLLGLGTRILGDAAEAEDVAQEAFIRVWRSAGSWRPGKARFDTWLHRVALNLCHDRLRRRREQPMAEPPEQVDCAPLPDAGISAAETGGQVERALQALPPRQREAIVLTYYQELPNIDAAAVMEVSVDALESLLSRGRRSLRGLLKEDKDEG